MENILRAYGDMVYRVALTHTVSREDAEDATQEVFLAYARQRPAFNSETHAKAWFLRVTIRICGKMRMSAKRRGTAELPQSAASPERVGGDVWLAFLSLPPKYKTVVYLFYYEHFSVRQIAATLSVSENAVKKRMERARAQLKEILGGDFGDET